MGTRVNSVLRNCAVTKMISASGAESGLFLAVLSKCAKFHQNRLRNVEYIHGRKKRIIIIIIIIIGRTKTIRSSLW